MIDFKNGSVFKLKANDEYRRTVDQLLIDGENIIGSFKGIRDGVVFTDKRIIAVNVQGITGKKRDFSSLPYSKIVAFSVEMAGTFDLDAELELWFSGLGKVKFEFSGRTDIAEISRLIAGFVLVRQHSNTMPAAGPLRAYRRYLERNFSTSHAQGEHVSSTSGRSPTKLCNHKS